MNLSLRTFIVLGFAAIASAHMGLSPTMAVGGSRAELTLRISHDCGDDTIGTTNFTIEMPMDPPMYSVKVHQVPVERVIINKRQLPAPVSVGKYNFTEVVSSINYLGFLPDGFYMTYKIRGIVPPVSNNTMMWFKGYQDCHNQGTSLAWASIPSEEDPSPRYPARGLEVVPAE